MVSSIQTISVLALLLATGTHAAELRDPTRPGWSPPNPNAEVAKPTPSLLTAIVLGPSKRLALIGKQYLAVGDTFGDGRIVRIDFDQVVLQSSSGQRIMRLTPVLETRTKAEPLQLRR